MANLNRITSGFDPNHGRRIADRYLQDVTARLKEIAVSRPFVAFAAVAVLILGFYFFIVATPIYVSQTQFAIRGREAPPAAGALLSLVGGGSDSSTELDTAELKQYVLSPEILARLDQRFHLRELYSTPRPDPLNWLPRSAPREEFLGFYKKMVSIQIDPQSNIITLTTRSYDPKSAKQLAEAIMEVSEAYVNDLSETVRNDTVRASLHDLNKAKDDVRAARLAMTAYRTSSGMLDPTATAAGQSAAVMSMKQEVLAAEADLASLKTYSTDKSPLVVQARARIAALNAQIDDQQKQIATAKNNNTLAHQLYEFEGLAIQNDYADKQLVAAQASYDSAVSLATQRDRFLVRIIQPNLPEKASEPHRLLSFLEALIVIVAAYGIIALAVAGVRDHQGI
jgi:capsular polysaccharide transport system permease protein